jgi:hypothetical protein
LICFKPATELFEKSKLQDFHHGSVALPQLQALVLLLLQQVSWLYWHCKEYLYSCCHRLQLVLLAVIAVLVVK